MSGFYVGLICQVMEPPPYPGGIWSECEIMEPYQGKDMGDWWINVPSQPCDDNKRGWWYAEEQHLRKFPDKDEPTEFDTDIWEPKELVEVYSQ